MVEGETDRPCSTTDSTKKVAYVSRDNSRLANSTVVAVPVIAAILWANCKTKRVAVRH